jgi:small GTP-binding protein
MKRKNCKVIVVGDSTVGKTSLIYALKNIPKDEEQPLKEFRTCTTIGCSYSCLTDSIDLALHVWDTAGQERFRSIVPQYFRSARVVILAFDRTNEESFDHAQNDWLPMIFEYVRYIEETILVIVENKIDLKEESTFKPSDIWHEELDKFYKVLRYQTSAIQGDGVREMRSEIFKTVRELTGLRESEIDPNDLEGPISKMIYGSVIKLKDIGSSIGNCSC